MKPEEFEYRDPPPAYSRRNEEIAAVRAAAQARPGQWLVAKSGGLKETQAFQQQLRRRLPAGHTVSMRAAGDGVFEVFVKYTPPEDET